MAWVQQPHVNTSLRPAKPTGEQALAEGQEERPRSGTLFPGILKTWLSGHSSWLPKLSLPSGKSPNSVSGRGPACHSFLHSHRAGGLSVTSCSGGPSSRQHLQRSRFLPWAQSRLRGTVSLSRSADLFPCSEPLAGSGLGTSLPHPSLAVSVCLCPASQLSRHAMCPPRSQTQVHTRPEGTKTGSGNFSIL